MFRLPKRPASGASSNPFGLAQVVPRVVLTVFVVEWLIMAALSRLSLREPYQTIADAGALALLTAPVIYFWIVRPLRQRIHRHLAAEEAHEGAVERRLTQLAALHQLGEMASLARDVDETCRYALDAVAIALGPDRSAVVLMDEAGRPRFRAWNGLSEAYRLGIEDWEARNGPGYLERRAAVRDAASDELPEEMRRVILAEGIVAGARHTIVHEGRLIGRLILYWNRPHTMDESDIRLAQTIAAHIAVVIDRVRREAEQRRLAHAVDATAESIVLTDGDGRILRVNTAFTTITGYTAEDALGRTPRVLKSGVQDGAFYDQMWGAIRAGQNWSGRLVNRRKDGTEYHASLAIAPVFDEAARVAGFVGVERDITDDIRREEELRRNAANLATAYEDLVLAKESAEAAARAKAEFLATMSHEIRTPMNGVLGFAHLLGETGLTDEQREYVNTIRSSGQSLLGLLNDILDFSKIEAGRMSLERVPFDLERTLRDVVGLLQPQAAERGISIDFEPGPDLPAILLGDPGRVRQVATNLVGNAVKFTPRGRVTVRTRREPEVSGLRVEVVDTGIGIPADKLGGLFQHFAQVDASTTRRFGGTGLGLAISKHLVELMDGTIGVESDEGRGSTFWFTLPLPLVTQSLAGGERANEPETPGLRLQRGGEPLRVLVAEDNTVNQKLARRLLEKAGCEVDVANNGGEAVEMVLRGTYHLVIMDCHMPEMDGFEATRAIRRRRPRDTGLPIIALTASALQSDHDACLAAGMDDFLSKPIVPETLHRCLERWAA
jgi:PAS domain S-box-containing protein